MLLSVMDIEAQMRQKLEEDLSPHTLEIMDESSMHGRSNPSHFRVLVVSDAFEGLNRVQRHQKVYSILGTDIMSKIHAFSQQTYTLREWKESGIQISSPPCHHKK